jgi:hypothetical protein
MNIGIPALITVLLFLKSGLKVTVLLDFFVTFFIKEES